MIVVYKGGSCFKISLFASFEIRSAPPPKFYIALHGVVLGFSVSKIVCVDTKKYHRKKVKVNYVWDKMGQMGQVLLKLGIGTKNGTKMGQKTT